MQIGDYLFAVDSVTKFYSSIYISGWFHHASNRLIGVEFVHEDFKGVTSCVGLAHGGVEKDLGPNKGFSVQALRSSDRIGDLEKLEVVFIVSDGSNLSVPVARLLEERSAMSPAFDLSNKFFQLVQAGPGARLLDVGGRDRSRIDRSKSFPGIQTIVLDILPGDNVDVVGDAHGMSQLFPEEHFDFVYSVSVFEHLLMPWKVACEMNRVMKPGALGFVHSHQAIGIHDAPWDFFRFSDNAWEGLFNRQTGFQLIRAVMDHPQYLIPFLYRDGKEDAERSAGFESSAVLFRKIGLPKVSWDVPLSEVLNTSYPQS